MITQIKPIVEFARPCPNCGARLIFNEPVWQGIHVCSRACCSNCESDFLIDLPHGQGNVTPFALELKNKKAFPTPTASDAWYSDILSRIQFQPDGRQIECTVEKYREVKKVIILNTLDFLYGHSLLEFFNLPALLSRYPEFGVVVVIQPFLRWLVPDGVAEIWQFDLPMKDARRYFSSINERIRHECSRFDEIHLARADVSPTDFDISHFTRVPVHDFASKEFRITFIWREDVGRLWMRKSAALRILPKFRLATLLIARHKKNIVTLFRKLRLRMPDAHYTIAGLGTRGAFPNWIDDKRVDRFDEENERRLCQIYSESRLVIGIHGSSMILPSAQAGMAVSLMPQKRWGNFAQDLIYKEHDDRLASFQRRILPLTIEMEDLADICENMIRFRDGYLTRMVLPFAVDP